MRLFPRRLLPRFWPTHRKFHDRARSPRVVAITGFPRSGTTMAKRFLGDLPQHLELAEYGSANAAWTLAERSEPGRIVVAKRTAFLQEAAHIDLHFGNAFWFLCVVRDPRDILLSLDRIDVHQELARDETTLRLWGDRMETFVQFLARRRRRGDHVRLVRYEDLARAPERAKEAFLRWIGVEDAGLDVKNEYSQRDAGFVDRTLRTEDPNAHRHSRVHTASIQSWRRTADDPRFAALASHPPTQRMMALFDYDLPGGSPASGGNVPMLIPPQDPQSS